VEINYIIKRKSLAFYYFYDNINKYSLTQVKSALENFHNNQIRGDFEGESNYW